MPLCLLILCSCTGREAPPPEPDEPAPTILPQAAAPSEDDEPPSGRLPVFALPTAAGDTLRHTDLQGKVVLLNFWATWCPPCIQEIPDLVALHQALREQGLRVVGVSVDEPGFEVVRPFVQQEGIRYPVVVDDGFLSAQLGGVWSLPTTLIINPEGAVVHRVIGLFPVQEMRPALEAMLQEAATGSPPGS